MCSTYVNWVSTFWNWVLAIIKTILKIINFWRQKISDQTYKMPQLAPSYYAQPYSAHYSCVLLLVLIIYLLTWVKQGNKNLTMREWCLLVGFVIPYIKAFVLILLVNHMLLAICFMSLSICCPLIICNFLLWVENCFLSVYRSVFFSTDDYRVKT